MRDNSRIENRIADILVGTGLPLDRRSEIAEELRGHLEQSIASKCEAGLSDGQAVEAVLAEFGSPAVIRRQLNRQQRMLDRRHALAEVRRQIWLPLVFAGFPSIVPAILAPAPCSLLMRFLGGVAVFAHVFLLTAGFMYAATVFGYQIQRPRPRKEHHFPKRCLRWMAIVALGLMWAVAMPSLLIAAYSPLMNNRRFYTAEGFPWAFCSYYGVAWLESPGRNFGLCALGVLGFGLAIALYERSRCVDEPSPAA